MGDLLGISLPTLRSLHLTDPLRLLRSAIPRSPETKRPPPDGPTPSAAAAFSRRGDPGFGPGWLRPAGRLHPEPGAVRGGRGVAGAAATERRGAADAPHAPRGFGFGAACARVALRGAAWGLGGLGRCLV